MSLPFSAQSLTPAKGRQSGWRPMLLNGVLSLGLLASFSAVGQTHEISTATDLRQTPALNGKVLRKLNIGTPVNETGRQAGWLRIKADNQQEGWVRLTHLKPLGASQASSSNPLTGLGGMFSAISTKPTATTGTRGLSAEDLAQAEPNLQQVQQLNQYASTPQAARNFARQGKLSAQNLPGYEADQ